MGYNLAEMTPDPTPSAPLEDTYAFQREELLSLLQRLSKKNESLILHGVERLTADDAAHLLHKIRQGSVFSGRERRALMEAGFDLPSLFPTL